MKHVQQFQMKQVYETKMSLDVTQLSPNSMIYIYFISISDVPFEITNAISDLRTCCDLDIVALFFN